MKNFTFITVQNVGRETSNKLMEFFKALPSDQELDWETLCAQKLSLQMQLARVPFRVRRHKLLLLLLLLLARKAEEEFQLFSISQ